jgi:FkbM family methyltransferase
MVRLGLVQCVIVEPDRSEALLLERAQPRCKIIRKALGDRHGTATLYITAEPGWSSLLRPLPSDNGGYSVEREEEVVVVPWDSLKDVPAPTFVKLDVQGYELNALNGMVAALRDSVLAIQIETTFVRNYDQQPLIQDVWSWLDTHGFNLCDIRALGVHDRGTIEFNAFFIRREMSPDDRLAVDFWKRLLRIPSHEFLIGRSD